MSQTPADQLAPEPQGPPTINDVARLAGVSKKTVSRVINDSPDVQAHTRRKVQAVIALTGYAPDPVARGLALRRRPPGSAVADPSALTRVSTDAKVASPAPARSKDESVMSKDRMAVLAALMDQGVIPVFYHPDVEVCIGVIQACANGGAKCVEFTNRGDFAADAFLQVTRHFAQADPSVIMGVGSVVEAPTAGLYIAHGAKFVVGPYLNPEVARVCNRRKIPYSPGCGTASEIGQAEELGCEIVKMFPGASVGGPDFVRNILGPMPWTRIMPTGGVEPSEQSLRAWFDAGVVAVGMGSGLVTKALLEARDYGAIEQRVRGIVEMIRTLRGKS